MRRTSKQYLTPAPAEPPPVHERPKCFGCQKPRKVVINREEKAGATFQEQMLNKARGETVSYYYPGYGHFCTLRCAAAFANKLIDAKLS